LCTLAAPLCGDLRWFGWHRDAGEHGVPVLVLLDGCVDVLGSAVLDVPARLGHALLQRSEAGGGEVAIGVVQDTHLSAGIHSDRFAFFGGLARAAGEELLESGVLLCDLVAFGTGRKEQRISGAVTAGPGAGR